MNWNYHFTTEHKESSESWGFFQINNRYTSFIHHLILRHRWVLFNLPSARCLRRFRRPATNPGSFSLQWSSNLYHTSFFHKIYSWTPQTCTIKNFLVPDLQNCAFLCWTQIQEPNVLRWKNTRNTSRWVTSQWENTHVSCQSVNRKDTAITTPYFFHNKANENYFSCRLTGFGFDRLPVNN